MPSIEFISHSAFPEDEYIKELVYLCLEGKYRVAYVRKKSQNGGEFWSVVSLGIKSGGKREYFPAFIQDSRFLEADIKAFLERRSWEKGKPVPQEAPREVQPSASVFDETELPF
jgi:hypothetical protein